MPGIRPAPGVGPPTRHNPGLGIMPQVVEREFREFLLCGVFEAGVARFQCEGCGREHLVPFSCKRREWCPSCGGRRMTERAARLVDAVLPWVPVRQWVLTVPYPAQLGGAESAWRRRSSALCLQAPAPGAAGRVGAGPPEPRPGCGRAIGEHRAGARGEGPFVFPTLYTASSSTRS